MAITAEQVNTLRKKTGAGMMDCKKALTEAGGDIDKAVDILRKKGAAVAAKRADREATEGIIAAKVKDDHRAGVIVEVNCETDFVAKSDDFVKFAEDILETAFDTMPKDSDELIKNNKDIENQLSEVTGKVGEKTEIGRIVSYKKDNGLVKEYIHPGSKLGVLVAFDNVEKDQIEAFLPIAKDIAMQVAAMNAIAVDREGVDKDLVNKELEVYKELAKKEGKPENIIDKIAEGKLNKFFEENTLTEQIFIKDNAKKVKEIIEDFNKENSAKVEIDEFTRIQLGE